MGQSAVFTIVKNESKFLPVWLNYYHKFFDFKDIYIIDNGSVDGSTDNLPCNVEKIESHYSFDVYWLCDTVKDKQAKLLKEYPIVLFTEVDEIVVPKRQHFENCLDKHPTINCVAFEVCHDPKTEPEINWETPLLRQRKYWLRDDRYDKPLLSKTPVKWVPGFHRCDSPSFHNNTMTLIHLRKIDYNFLKARVQDRRTWEKPPNDKPRTCWQWKASDSRFEKWFTDGSGNRELIPERFKNVC